MKPIRVLIDKFLLDDFLHDIKNWLIKENFPPEESIVRDPFVETSRSTLYEGAVIWEDIRKELLNEGCTFFFLFASDQEDYITCADGNKYTFEDDEEVPVWDTTCIGLTIKRDEDDFLIAQASNTFDEGEAVYPEENFKLLEKPFRKFLNKYLSSK